MKLVEINARAEFDVTRARNPRPTIANFGSADYVSTGSSMKHLLSVNNGVTTAILCARASVSIHTYKSKSLV